MNYTIEQTSPDKNSWETFCKLPGFTAYEHPLYKVNERVDISYLKTGFIAFNSSGNCSGRIAVYFNPYHQKEGSLQFIIGNIETENNVECFTLLLNKAKDYVQLMNGTSIIGPMNGSTWNSYRFTLSNDTAPFLLEPITPPYYIDFFHKSGFKEIAHYISQKTESIITNKEKVKARLDQFKEQGVSFKPFDLENPSSEFSAISKLCNKAFRKNLFFSPIDEDKFIEKMLPILKILQSEYTILAWHNGLVVGFIFAYHDLYNTKEKCIIVKTLARDIDGPYQGMGSILSSMVMEQAAKDQFNTSIHALMIEDNASRRVSNKFIGSVFREYALYEISLK